MDRNTASKLCWRRPFWMLSCLRSVLSQHTKNLRRFTLPTVSVSKKMLLAGPNTAVREDEMLRININISLAKEKQE